MHKTVLAYRIHSKSHYNEYIIVVLSFFSLEMEIYKIRSFPS